MPSRPPAIAAELAIARIQAAIAAIAPGEVSSYGVIAQRAGLPGRARLVGRVLREAPASLELPWHRVLRADGRSAFVAGSEAYREQCQRLAAEGVLMQEGRVKATAQQASSDLDSVLWGDLG